MTDQQPANDNADHAAQLRAEADLMEQSDRARAANLRRDADELDPPQDEAQEKLPVTPRAWTDQEPVKVWA
jgi:hypothetical protein